ncbi:hypothetical protein P872_14270 [Rhodonellum psychrophilum GCM71 = DSM 17998]|uniref:Uncharacterized protein n=1 Tax=Rhodonellum psychrophilum GCM71 = DSM 17998 TaxID=1123057 RepID=U5BQL6_9BACT|nr:hypothetical protein P872_14270 [Rhodonellum psychrophilum GCM71 = DSM 17998]
MKKTDSLIYILNGIENARRILFQRVWDSKIKFIFKSPAERVFFR